MPDEVRYLISEQQDRFEANFNGQKIGEITFVRVGIDKLIIELSGCIIKTVLSVRGYCLFLFFNKGADYNEIFAFVGFASREKGA